VYSHFHLKLELCISFDHNTAFWRIKLTTLSQKSATVAKNGETTATVVALFCDSGQALREPTKALSTLATIVADFGTGNGDNLSRIRRLVASVDKA